MPPLARKESPWWPMAVVPRGNDISDEAAHGSDDSQNDRARFITNQKIAAVKAHEARPIDAPIGLTKVANELATETVDEGYAPVRKLIVMTLGFMPDWLNQIYIQFWITRKEMPETLASVPVI